MINDNIVYIYDGDGADKNIIDIFNIENLCKEGKYNFVGFINKSNKILCSLPKHFGIEGSESNISLLLKAIEKGSNSCLGSSVFLDSNIPFKQYIFIYEYYKNFGLYTVKEELVKYGYSGRIDWYRTLKYSNKIFCNDNLLYIPFIIRKDKNTNTFIGDCMLYVINDAYEQFAKYLQIGEKIECKLCNNYPFWDHQKIITMLLEERGKVFKDTEFLLIDNLILYFKWLGSLSDNIHFITQSFNLLWEIMVNNYLNNYFSHYDEDLQQIVFRKGFTNFKFKKLSEPCESSGIKCSHNFRVEYDHFFEDKDNNVIYVFDSKYYEKITELNYKQVTYHYFLLNRYNNKGNENSTPKIINGLILPTEKDYHSKVHLDRRKIDGVYIQEHYLNLKTVMESFIK